MEEKSKGSDLTDLEHLKLRYLELKETILFQKKIIEDYKDLVDSYKYQADKYKNISVGLMLFLVAAITFVVFK